MASSPDRSIVIVGASLAGAKAAERLRKGDFDGPVVLIGAESELPYERPPLSKDYLLGKAERTAVRVHDEAWYAANDVDLRLGVTVTGIDPEGHTVETDDGERLGFSRLLLTTGSSPRRLDVPGADLDGVHYLRKLPDSDALRDVFGHGGRVVVVGAGWIGLETAAAARERGCEVTVVEPQPAPLRAALGDELGGWFGSVHRAHGVDLRLGTGIARITGEKATTGVVTGDGTEIAADAVVVGVGITPNVELAERAGLSVDNGVLVDARLGTSHPDVYAAGDVANGFLPRYGRHVRVEHWANALNGGPAAARAMLGEDVTYDRIPYFFTDQYDVGMEFSGWFPPGGYDGVVLRGSLDEGAFFSFWLSGGRVVAGMHVNMWDDGVGPVEALIDGGAQIDERRLADPSVPLNELAG
ncbi:MAG: NAD(P)/FAD-dependent oxidoreductase [Streptosporangiales bacterium]|nr:NAD(P)/FAD-dependent oxidoreductase [Streptosporangiales bacterium]MBO0892296.1 NAD(P)/FAD-dependent oxidoreductase [Acidothermales bacterium]